MIDDKMVYQIFFFPDIYCRESAERWERMDTESQKSAAVFCTKVNKNLI